MKLRRLKTPARAACSGLLMAASFPLAFSFLGGEPLLPPVSECLAWFGLLPLLAALERAGPRAAFGWGVLAGACFFGLCLYWLAGAISTFGHLPLAVSLLILALLVGFLSLFWGTAFGAAALFRRRLGLAEIWTLPPLWAALEFLRNYLLTGFPWASLGTGQARTLWLAQLAWLGGPYLVAYVVVWTNCALDVLLRWLRGRGPLPAKAIALWAGCLAATAILAAVRLTRHWQGEMLRVALVQGNLDERAGLRGGAAQRWVQERMLRLSAEAAEKASLVVWPEGTLPEPLMLSQLRQEDAPLMAWSGQEKFSVWPGELIVGAIVRQFGLDGYRLYNSALLLDGGLRLRERYDKRHLVPFGEYVPLERLLPLGWFMPYAVAFFSPGTGHRPLQARAGALGMMICYEAIFPEIARETAAAGAQVLVNITNDSWYGPTSAPYQHLEQSRMRAIENARFLVRAANTGVSAIVDPAGRVLGRLPLGLAPAEAKTVTVEDLSPPGLLLGTVNLLQDATPYRTLGDWAAWLCAAFSFCCLAFSLLRRTHSDTSKTCTSGPQSA